MLEQYGWQSPNSSASVFDGRQLPRAPCLGSSNPSHQVEIEWRKGGRGSRTGGQGCWLGQRGLASPLPSGPCSLTTVDRGRGGVPWPGKRRLAGSQLAVGWTRGSGCPRQCGSAFVGAVKSPQPIEKSTWGGVLGPLKKAS